VDFRGVVVGEVLSMGVEYEPAREWFHFPVYVAIYPERIAMRRAPGAAPGNAEADAQRVKKGLIKAIVERGFRAQLRTGNLLTGQLYVALDFFKDAKKVVVNPAAVPQEFPTVYASLEDLQASLGRILKNLEQVPFAEVAADARLSLQGLDKLARRLDAETAPEAQAALASLRLTLGNLDRTLAADAPLLSEVRDATREISRAAQALRSLADTLDRQPEALLKGKREEQP
jgi:paraquat-inducible protein B